MNEIAGSLQVLEWNRGDDGTRTAACEVRIQIDVYLDIMNDLERPVVWLGSCRRDLRSFPREVRREIGAALYAVQQGDTDPAAKPMKGFGGASVLEIVSDYRGNTWRAIYTIRFR